MELKIINEIKEKAQMLKLETFNANLDRLLENNISLDIIKAINTIFEEEVKFKKQRAARIGLKIANFPFLKRFEDFDFSFQPSINEGKIISLSTLNFIENQENILFIGTPGVGKTHLAVSLGIQAVENKKSTYFVHCHKLIEDLRRAHFEGRLNRRIKKFASYKVLIIDEVGFIPFDDLAGKLLFQLVNARYVKHSTIITSNLELDKWNKLFEDSMIGLALLDRLLEKSSIIKIVGNSYRTKSIYNEIEET